VTIALLAALGHAEELAMHVRAALRGGVTEGEIRELLLHTAVYAAPSRQRTRRPFDGGARSHYGRRP
jgi:alkylhydroperoxidase/carboxymuconolactone decarboxylase family protein YurZ